MGCQCGKANEQANMNIESAPPKVMQEVENKNDLQSVNTHQKIPPTETANQSRVSNSRMDESKTGGKKKKKKKAAEGNYDIDLLNEINKVRSNPNAFADKIEEAMSRIKTDEGKVVFETESGSKIALVQGVEAFKLAANKMRHFTPTNGFEYKEDLIIPVPEDSKDWKKQDLITNSLAKRRNENGGKYSEYLFNMDLGVSDAFYSVLLQIVDDSPFKGKRCDNIMNKDFKYIGISHQKQGKNKFCTYITFAK
jgi:hypothetical protein